MGLSSGFYRHRNKLNYEDPDDKSNGYSVEVVRGKSSTTTRSEETILLDLNGTVGFMIEKTIELSVAILMDKKNQLLIFLTNGYSFHRKFSMTENLFERRLKSPRDRLGDSARC